VNKHSRIGTLRHIVSAPVSRRDAGGPRERSRSSVRLSPAELEIAKAAGITETQYAQGKHKMLRERE
jgi:hypothetical protein